MIFSVNKLYEITFKNGETTRFQVLNSTTVLYLTRVMDLDSNEGTFLYKLLEKEWVKLEEVKDDL